MHKIIIVKDKKTGEQIQIKDFRFNPALHAYVGGVLEEKAPEGIDLSFVPGLTPEEPAVPTVQAEESPVVVDAAKERFTELKKMKAWLKPELKAEYELLKSVYGKKTKSESDTSGTTEGL